MSTPFRSAAELREVLDRIFTIMSEDPEMGPALRDADVPQRFEFDDLDLVLNVRARRGAETANLHWRWSEEVDWEPKVTMSMSSEIANRYFQGAESIPLAIARRRIRARGDIRAALALIPITRPVHERYRAIVAAEYQHLRL